MGKNFIYPEVIDQLRDVCGRCLSGEASLDELQHLVQIAESTIVAVEEKELRNFLTQIEGELELVRFMVDCNRQAGEARKIAGRVLKWLAS